MNGGIKAIDDNDLNELNQMSNAMHSGSTTYLDGKSFISYMSTDDTIPIRELLSQKLESEKKMYGLIGIIWKGLNPNIPIIVDEKSIPKELKKDDVYKDIDSITKIWDDATNRQLFVPVEHEDNLNPPKLADKKRDYKNTISWTPLGKTEPIFPVAQTGWWAGKGPDPKEDRGKGQHGNWNRDAKDGELYTIWESDIEYNSDLKWQTSNENEKSKYSIMTIGLHEMGHLLGLRDIYTVAEQNYVHLNPSTYPRYIYPNDFESQVDNQIMHGVGEKNGNTLGAGDIAGIQRLYPDYSDLSSWHVMPNEHIQDYIDKSKSDDIITIAPGKYSENLKIPISLTLNGAGNGEDGTIVDGDDSGSVISIIGSPDLNINVRLSNMLINNGLSTLGGGIYNFGSTLTVDGCSITGNDATQSGGGIYNSGALTVKNSNIKGNTAAYGGAGIYNEHGTFNMDSGAISDNTASYFGGGIYNVYGSSTINGGTISKNNAYEGAGIYNDHDDFTMNGGTISKNSAHSDTSGLSGSGGGVANNGGKFVLNAGTISDNTADYAGGGVWNSGCAFTMNDGTISGNRANKGGGIATYWGTFALKDGTISGNTADQYGGGIFNSGTTTITDGKISQNIAINDGGGIYNDGTLIFQLPDGSAIPQSDPRVGIIAFDNHLGNLNGPINNIAPEILKEWTVKPGELIQDYIKKAISGDTITILAGIFNENLVIDKSLTLKGAGNTESGTVVKGLGTDSVFTIGKVDPNIDVKLCDMLIRNGIRNGVGTLDPNGDILGGGILNEGKLTVDHCTITDNGYSRGMWGDSRPTTLGGGIYSSGDLTITSSTISRNDANCGGGIYNNGGNLILTDSEITGNGLWYYTSGGGIYNNGGNLILTDSEITGNYAGYYTSGGAGILNAGTIEMVSGTVSGNSGHGGSGVKNWGTFTMKGGAISNNIAYNGPAGTWATSSGGGVDNGGTFNLEGGIISGNYAYRGGGVSNGGTFNLKGGSISSNVYHAPDGTEWVPYDGSGVYNSGTLNLEGGSISGNKAYNDGGGIFNSGTVNPSDYSTCNFGTGADANTPNDHN
jgi:hypothetical protein